MISNRFDAIVVGTGAGGACVAYQLATAGLRVLALEKGPSRELGDFFEGGVFGAPFTSRGRGDELKYINSEYLMPEMRNEVRYLSYANPGEQQPEATPTTSGWMSQLVGGGTVHYGGASFRMDDVDFRMRSTFEKDVRDLEPSLSPALQADLQDWPMTADEFRPWYSMAERLIGIAGAPDSGLRPLRYNKAAQLLDAALRKTGHDARICPTPMAINNASHLGRQPCHHSGLCQDYACRFEAKSDMRVTLLREATATGNLEIQPLSFVRRLNKSGDRIKSIEVLVGHPGGEHKVIELEADIFVVACEAVETSRLLMHSEIGNRDVLGRYIMFHMTGGARSIAPDPTTTWDTAPHTAYIPSYYHDRSTDPPFLKTGVFLVSSNGGPLGELKYSNYWGTTALAYFKEIYPFKMDLSYIGECMPTEHNRVELTKDRDRYGLPGTKITYKPHPFDQNAGEHMARKAKEILRVAGGVVEDDAPAELKPFLRKSVSAKRLFHGSGGCRMGIDPKISVVDAACRVHGLQNIYIADASVFPTGSGVNPTLTIQANALRVGAHIAGVVGAQASYA